MPAYNEADRIGTAINAYRNEWDRRLAAVGKSYELIVVANGCTDETAQVVRELAASSPSTSVLRLIEFPHANKGLAVLEGFRAAKGEVVGFTDADGAISPEVMLEIMQLAEGGKVAIGSKYLTGVECDHRQPFVRRFASRGWHLLVRLVVGLRVTDTQAGAKALPAECVRTILDRVVPCNFAFDVSLLWEAKKAGYEIVEIPLTWDHLDGSKFHLMREVPRMFFSLIHLRFVPKRGVLQPRGALRHTIVEEFEEPDTVAVVAAKVESKVS